MEIRDFVANRSFSENGPMAVVLKTRASASRGGFVGRRVRAAVGVAIPTTGNRMDHIHYPTRADHHADRGTYLSLVSVVHRSLVRCAVPGCVGGSRKNDQGNAIAVEAMNTRTASRTLRTQERWAEMPNGLLLNPPLSHEPT
jgi:hypothetical protein